MKNVKFRAWDKFAHGFVIPKLILVDGTGKVWIVEDEGRHYEEIGGIAGKDLIIDQYIGIRDKNNKEIYDGDIIQGDFDGWIDTAYVFWNLNKGWCLKLISTHGDCDFTHPKFCDEKHIEIIGNIHENPEMM
jgi:uncharacterized phage protein (TIGR01671 family)